jgi:2-polyprenyl-3-methyl-5-hydroxy-6-metoxy-1,4-benzoquinol methylase
MDSAVGVPVELDLPAIAGNLQRREDGVWASRTRADISYPEEGNLNCLSLEADSFWFAHRSRCIEAVMRLWQPPGTLLDIGGGNGYVAAGLQRAGFSVAMLEPGELGVQTALRRGVQTLVCSTLEDAHFAPGTLPAAGLFDVLEHIENDREFLIYLHSLLRTGGRVYLTVPAYPLLWSADDDYAGHHRRYTHKSLAGVLRSAGFTVEYITGMFFMLPAPIFLLRAVPSRLGLRKQQAWDRYQAEHRSRGGAAGGLLDWLLERELAFVKQGRSFPFGASCLAVARR